MNKVVEIGRLYKDVEMRYSQNDSSMAIASFGIAVDRRGKQNTEQTADFISCKAFGKTAEFLEKYFHKGMKIAIVGHIQTGSYTNKDGNKVYTTDVIADEVEFVESKNSSAAATTTSNDGFMNIPEGADEELPFN